MNNSIISVFNDPDSPEVPVNIGDSWIDDATYLQVVQKTIVVCTDTVFIVEGEEAIYLAKRSMLPMKGIWCFGGRMLFNDPTPNDSVSRCVKRETGVLIDPKRFKQLSVNLYSWNRILQGDFPGRNLGIMFSCKVSHEEIDQMAKGLSDKEYDTSFGIQAYNCFRIVDEKIHRALDDAYTAYFL